MKVPIGISNRHVHLRKEDYEVLFGNEEMVVQKELSQPGQFASTLVVTVATEKDKLERVRVLGPVRDYTQVELSQTDAYRLGIKPPVRDSGDLENASVVEIIGPVGKVKKACAIIATRHIHLNKNDREMLGLNGIEEVNVHFDTLKSATLEHVKLKEDDSYILEMHLDTDDANALLLNNNDYGEIIL